MKGSRSSQPAVSRDDAFTAANTVTNADTASSADAGMGSGSPFPPAPPPTPTGTPIYRPSGPFRVTTVPSNSRLRTYIIVGVFVVFIVGIAIPLISVGNTISDFGGSFQSGSPTPVPGPNGGGSGSGASGSGGAAKASRAPKHLSYLTAAGARAGLAEIAKRAPGARLSLVRLAATSISATARLSNGTSKLIAIEPTGPFVESTPGSGERSLPISQIKPSVVAKLVAEMRTRFHVPASRIDYMVLSSPARLSIHWILFTKAPSHPGYSASLSGGHLVRLP
jgi:hypothetical protein